MPYGTFSNSVGSNVVLLILEASSLRVVLTFLYHSVNELFRQPRRRLVFAKPRFTLRLTLFGEPRRILYSAFISKPRKAYFYFLTLSHSKGMAKITQLLIMAKFRALLFFLNRHANTLFYTSILLSSYRLLSKRMQR